MCSALLEGALLLKRKENNKWGKPRGDALQGRYAYLGWNPF
jgi:hypothetical protein